MSRKKASSLTKSEVEALLAKTGLTKSEIARLCNLSAASVWRWLEDGRSFPEVHRQTIEDFIGFLKSAPAIESPKGTLERYLVFKQYNNDIEEITRNALNKDKRFEVLKTFTDAELADALIERGWIVSRQKPQ